MNLRLQKHPILSFKRDRPLSVYLKGKQITAYEGETIAAALYASGIKEYSRSVKYDRPRGFFCAVGKCSSCLMRVDGIPHVRTCITPVRDGMKIEYEKGRGERPTISDDSVKSEPIEKIDTDMTVIGGGPAGLSAATVAANLGVDVLVVDENLRPGGQLVKQSHKFFGSRHNYAGIRGTEIAGIVLRELGKTSARCMTNASATGYYEGKKHLLTIVQDNQKLVEVTTKRIVVATGAQENMLAFPNNDLPGVCGAGGVQTLMNVYGVKPGNDAIVIGAGNVGLILAYQLIQAGVRVKMVIEALPNIGGYLVHASKLRRQGIPILVRHTIKAAIGRAHVEGAIVVALDKNWQPIEGTEENVEADLICLAVGLMPSSEILFQAGCRQAFIPELGGQVAIHNEDLETTLDGIYVAGDSSGIEEASTAMMEGRITGAEIAMEFSKRSSDPERIRSESLRHLEALRTSPFSEKVLKGKKKVWNLWRDRT